MSTIFICGHKNPDTDSIASAVSYGYLKSIVDDKYKYQPIRCGNASKQTTFIFENAKVELPLFVSDIYPKVVDNMTKDVITLMENDPVSLLLTYIKEHDMRSIPVVDEENNYKGMTGIIELAKLFITDDIIKKPILTLRSDTLKRSLKATVLKVGELEEFRASILTPMMSCENSQQYNSNLLKEEELIVITSNNKDILDGLFKKNYPAVVLVGLKEKDFSSLDFKNFQGWVFASPFDLAQTVRYVELATPIKKIMDVNMPYVMPSDYVDVAADILNKNNIKAVPVTFEGKLEGIITNSDILNKKSQKIIMMDHNEISQAIDGIESAEIVGIIDHHRLGTIKTINPVSFYAKPVGSTCTLVYQQYKIHQVDIPKKYAMLLLGGILSDTVIMKSPTTTIDDIQAIEELGKISNIDVHEYGLKIFSATDGLASRKVHDIINTDFKVYNEYDTKIGVGQVETVTLNDLNLIKDAVVSELKKINGSYNINWSMLLVTDIIKEESVLLSSGYPKAESMLQYDRLDNQSFFLPGVLSRKKQLLPEILRVLEEITR